MRIIMLTILLVMILATFIDAQISKLRFAKVIQKQEKIEALLIPNQTVFVQSNVSRDNGDWSEMKEEVKK
ncbi:MAG: hypothetical protein AAFO07_09210 [Bacteroidota bacterium]